MKKLAFLFCLSTCFGSCIKFNNCSDGCTDIDITGTVINMETGLGIANVPVEIYERHFSMAMFTKSDERLKRGKTDKSGKFSFTCAVDNYNINSIYVEMPATDINFIYAPRPCAQISSFSTFRSGTTNLVFKLYPKTTLTLKLKRPINSTAINGEVYHTFLNEAGPTRDYVWNGTDFINNRTITAEVGVGEDTKITWNKTDASQVFTSFSDSIKCKRNSDNVFEITF
jgi:hypothetical protein